jgi:hypothetical protein
MATNFFAKFPTIDYNMDGRGSLLELTNIVKNVDVNDVYANNATYYTYHEIQDGERPDTVSYRLYDNPNYYWTFFIINNDLRAGINNAWPISSNQLERMMVDEYDPHSAITFKPQNTTDINGLNKSGLVQLIHLWEDYIPYLRLVSQNKAIHAKILKYDNALLQLVVNTIENVDGSGVPPTNKTFLESSYFTLSWVNPFDEITEADSWNACDAARVDFIDKTIAVYAEFDESAIIDPSRFSTAGSQAEINAAIAKEESDYAFGKQYVPMQQYDFVEKKMRNMAWDSYRKAPAEYYEDTDQGPVTVSAYDVITNPDIVTPKYISYHAKESIINERKTKIRVIRRDRIADFISEYFKILNG